MLDSRPPAPRNKQTGPRRCRKHTAPGQRCGRLASAPMSGCSTAFKSGRVRRIRRRPCRPQPRPIEFPPTATIRRRRKLRESLRGPGAARPGAEQLGAPARRHRRFSTPRRANRPSLHRRLAAADTRRSGPTTSATSAGEIQRDERLAEEQRDDAGDGEIGGRRPAATW